MWIRRRRHGPGAGWPGRSAGRDRRVRHDDGRFAGTARLAVRVWGDARSLGKYGCLLETGLLHAGGRVHAAADQHAGTEASPWPEDRREGQRVAGPVAGMRVVAAEFRAPAAHSGVAGLDAVSGTAGARSEP